MKYRHLELEASPGVKQDLRVRGHVADCLDEPFEEWGETWTHSDTSSDDDAVPA